MLIVIVYKYLFDRAVRLVGRTEVSCSSAHELSQMNTFSLYSPVSLSSTVNVFTQQIMFQNQHTYLNA